MSKLVNRSKLSEKWACNEAQRDIKKNRIGSFNVTAKKLVTCKASNWCKASNPTNNLDEIIKLAERFCVIYLQATPV